jgi:hypothetical protein
VVVSKNTNGTGMFIYLFICLSIAYLLFIFCLLIFSGSWPMTPIMIVVEFSWIGSYSHPVVHVGVGKIHFRQSERNEKRKQDNNYGLMRLLAAARSLKSIFLY